MKISIVPLLIACTTLPLSSLFAQDDPTSISSPNKRIKMVVDIHDDYRPTGWSRTYPNLLTQEGIKGNETMPTPEENVTLPFTRYLCGAADYTVCYYSGRIQSTRPPIGRIDCLLQSDPASLLV